MLRKKREVTAPDEITDIIRRSTTLRVGVYGEEYLMSFRSPSALR